MPYIKQSTIEHVEESADILQVIKEFIELKKQGANHIGLSPFKKESTPSFTVSPTKGIWKCFATGKGGNSAISFLMTSEKMTYPDAIEYLAKKYSIEIEYDNSEDAKEQQKIQERRLELQPLLESTIRKYEEAFKNLPESHPAKLEVYGKRQYTDKEVEAYRIGYAPGGTFIYDLCLPQGRVTDAKEIGLVKEYSSYTADFFKDRVIYPLIERKGKSFLPVGLAGRDLSNTGKYSKWLNSTDSDLYKKETFWFGLDKAKETIVGTSEAWLVEGYNDVIAWQTHGILNTIASCGTAVSLRQMKILRKFAEKIILCFDPDSAGKKAMLKYIPQLLKLGFRVQLLLLNQDPDDSVRLWKNWIGKKPDLSEMSQERDYREEGFSW
jgi:DNA primase catalytic core